jgi:hypothetical protein
MATRAARRDGGAVKEDLANYRNDAGFPDLASVERRWKDLAASDDALYCDRCGVKPWTIAYGESGRCLCADCDAEEQTPAHTDDHPEAVVAWALVAVLAAIVGGLVIWAMGGSNG